MGAFSVMDHLLELLPWDSAFWFVRFFVDEAGLLCHVGGAEEEDAFCRQASAFGPPCFLVVAFDVLGKVMMNDESYVWFDDPHSEGNGRTDNPDLVSLNPFGAEFRRVRAMGSFIGIGSGFGFA